MLVFFFKSVFSWCDSHFCAVGGWKNWRGGSRKLENLRFFWRPTVAYNVPKYSYATDVHFKSFAQPRLRAIPHWDYNYKEVTEVVVVIKVRMYCIVCV